MERPPPLVATMICFDDSEFMRNEDYSPSRFEAQKDAVVSLCQARTKSDEKNTVGIITMAGKRVQVLVRLTHDFRHILYHMGGLTFGGESNLVSALQMAEMNLKHRCDRSLKKRIIVFTGSPIRHDNETLADIGKMLRKNSVALDIVDFGADDEMKSEKLEALLAAVNSNNNSRIVHVPRGQDLKEVVKNSPIFTTASEEDEILWVGPPDDRQPVPKDTAEIMRQLAKQQNVVINSENAERFLNDALKVKLGAAQLENILLHELVKRKKQFLQTARKLQKQSSSKESSSQQTHMLKVLANEDYLASLLEPVPGFDPDDPLSKELIASIKSWVEAQMKKEEEE